MSTPELLDTRREVYTPSRLNREVRALLEGTLPLIWIEGEISNLARPASGHLYFTLKDAAAQVRCALFRGRGRYLRFEPADGLAVLVRARVSLYEQRGEYQLIVEHMEPAGEGALRAEFERLRQKLEAEGLFRDELKRPLPKFPGRIGVITSPMGAAVRDVLNVLARRFPAVPVRIYPVPVQGHEAPPAIVRALAIASRRRDCDVLILTRGGGSLEDLWAFNEEPVVRAIRDCSIPVISAVGHEVDVTLSDLAADVRAPTPSAAAELAVPDGRAVSRDLARYRQQLQRQMRRLVIERMQRLDYAARSLAQFHPGARLRQYRERLAALRRRLVLAVGWQSQQRRRALRELATRLMMCNPRSRLDRAKEAAQSLRNRLARESTRLLGEMRRRLETASRNLTAVSPQATLNRGYAILRVPGSEAVIRKASDAPRGSRVEALLARGRLVARVEESHQNEDDDSR